jgi:hypothetical protein
MAINKKTLFTLTAPALLLGLSACATPFKAEVARFQQLPAPQGQSFVVTSNDPELANGLEFAQYAQIVEQEMAELGYVPAANKDSADLIVSFDYIVDNGRERVRSTGFGNGFGGGFGRFGGGFGRFGGGFGRFGGFRRFRGGRFGFGFNDPFIFGGGFNDVRSFTVYTSELDLKIDRAADQTRLFEGRAEAQSRSKNLPYLVPNLVEAMFTEFPGNSGETVRISIEPEKTKVKTISPRRR